MSGTRAGLQAEQQACGGRGEGGRGHLWCIIRLHYSAPAAAGQPAPCLHGCRDGGDVSHVAFSNIAVSTKYTGDNWWGAAEPIYITALPRAAGTKVRVLGMHWHSVHSMWGSGGAQLHELRVPSRQPKGRRHACC